MNRYFWLAILCHLLLFLSFSVKWAYHPKMNARAELEEKEKPAQYISSYVYQQSPPAPVQQKPLPPKETPKEKVVAAKDGYKKPVEKRPLSLSHPSQLRAMTLSKNNEEPVHLIGDKNNIAQPLIILLGKALTAHLSYPKIAIDFNLHGLVVVGFMLHPDGHITGLKLIKSSRAEILDESVLAAITAMSPIYHTQEYLSKPKFLEIGVLFE